MKELSPNNNLLKLALPIILTLLGLFLSIALLKGNLLRLITGVIITGGLGYLIIKRIYDKTENIFYDNDFLYLKNSKETRNIELKKIKRVKLTSSDLKILGFQFYEYRIEFKSRMKLNDSVTFWTSSINSKIWNFEEHLNYYSPITKIEHSSSSFNN